jgi:23S rRNA (guanosine2251-2'-O)-methyltransferase
VQIIYGINPVMEAFKHGSVNIEKVIVAPGRRGERLCKILNLAREKGIPVEFKDRTYIDRLAGNKSHQGIIGLCKAFTYASVDEVVAHRHESFKNDLILILDGITDPQNLGSLIRTAHCCGANGVIIPEKRAVSVTGAVMKASAGAAQYTPVAMVVNLSRTIEYLKKKGFWIYGADAHYGKEICNHDFDGHIGLVMGSEGKGISPLIKKGCDFLVSIPLMGNVDSLNVSVAAGIIMYEILKKWGAVGGPRSVVAVETGHGKATLRRGR